MRFLASKLNVASLIDELELEPDVSTAREVSNLTKGIMLLLMHILLSPILMHAKRGCFVG